MKYLRKYNEGFNKDDYYKLINKEEWEKLMYGGAENTYAQDNCLDIKEEYDKLIDIKSGFVYMKMNLMRPWNLERHYIFGEFNKYLRQKLEFTIYKLKDEWFIYNEYVSQGVWINYKCDQFEGLLELLKDKLIIK